MLNLRTRAKTVRRPQTEAPPRAPLEPAVAKAGGSAKPTKLPADVEAMDKPTNTVLGEQKAGGAATTGIATPSMKGGNALLALTLGAKLDTGHAARFQADGLAVMMANKEGALEGGYPLARALFGGLPQGLEALKLHQTSREDWQIKNGDDVVGNMQIHEAFNGGMIPDYIVNLTADDSAIGGLVKTAITRKEDRLDVTASTYAKLRDLVEVPAAAGGGERSFSAGQVPLKDLVPDLPLEFANLQVESYGNHGSSANSDYTTKDAYFHVKASSDPDAPDVLMGALRERSYRDHGDDAGRPDTFELSLTRTETEGAEAVTRLLREAFGV